MSVTSSISSDGKRIDIKITGRFNYTLSQAFRDAYRGVSTADDVRYHVDLSETEYMDSAALGMLLLLREYAKAHGAPVVIERPSEQAELILKGANFEQLFRFRHDKNSSMAA